MLESLLIEDIFISSTPFWDANASDSGGFTEWRAGKLMGAL